MGSVVAFSVLLEKKPLSHPEATLERSPQTRPISTGIVPAKSAQEELVPKAAEEKPIEEILLESGEDPGAVFYMSRVREALQEGNPEFARELLWQMKEEHEKSILVEEAERLLEKGRKP